MRGRFYCRLCGVELCECSLCGEADETDQRRFAEENCPSRTGMAHEVMRTRVTGCQYEIFGGRIG
jgi:hypothetical protein